MEKAMTGKPAPARQRLRRRAHTEQRGAANKPQPHAGTGPDHSDPAVAQEIRHAMIAEAAYYRAEKRGFAEGSELDDWLRAEFEIESLLKHGTTVQ